IAVRKYSVPHVFSPACMQQAESLPDHVVGKDFPHRVDLTDIALVTIDGEDAKDFDDAVYCEPLKEDAQDGWRLLVAIADVSHYVETESPIDIDAYERATSVYFPRRVIPMLPEKLSNGLCSLKPEVDRLCMVCDMMVSAEGEVFAYQFYEAVMHSHARLTYTDAAAILSNTRGPQAQKYKSIVNDLIHLHDVYRALLKARQKRGAVDFETTETQIICDDNGRIEKIVPRIRTEAHRLIEETMLAANVCSADFIQQNKHAALFRVHEGPTPEKLEILRSYLKSLGIGLQITEEPSPGQFQAIAAATKERVDAQQIHSMLLRSMQQAIYTPVNSGHFGLAYDAYTHFTSPIRRYPDLLVHRVIKSILRGTRYKLPGLPVPGEAQAKLSRRLASHAAKSSQTSTGKNTQLTPETQSWQAAGLHCSANERRADEASRDVEAWLRTSEQTKQTLFSDLQSQMQLRTNTWIEQRATEFSTALESAQAQMQALQKIVIASKDEWVTTKQKEFMVRLAEAVKQAQTIVQQATEKEKFALLEKFSTLEGSLRERQESAEKKIKESLDDKLRPISVGLQLVQTTTEKATQDIAVLFTITSALQSDVSSSVSARQVADAETLLATLTKVQATTPVSALQLQNPLANLVEKPQPQPQPERQRQTKPVATQQTKQNEVYTSLTKCFYTAVFGTPGQRLDTLGMMKPPPGWEAFCFTNQSDLQANGWTIHPKI
ncbi:MAG: VacB/RNase II family 3'-5' exoribonuclease, partial [Betaproteobacteria bacterium]|nr:VacB/RNase II family 3'-5' exoribonuclease [Betaproteobacteria bacterium]